MYYYSGPSYNLDIVYLKDHLRNNNWLLKIVIWFSTNWSMSFHKFIRRPEEWSQIFMSDSSQGGHLMIYPACPQCGSARRKDLTYMPGFAREPFTWVKSPILLSIVPQGADGGEKGCFEIMAAGKQNLFTSILRLCNILSPSGLEGYLWRSGQYLQNTSRTTLTFSILPDIASYIREYYCGTLARLYPFAPNPRQARSQIRNRGRTFLDIPRAERYHEKSELPSCNN